MVACTSLVSVSHETPPTPTCLTHRAANTTHKKNNAHISFLHINAFQL